MKTLDNFIKIALIIFVSISFLSAQDIEITDYRIPQVKYKRLIGSFSGDWHQRSNSDSYYSSSYKDRSSDLAEYTMLNIGGDYIYSSYCEDDFLNLGIRMDGSLNSGDGKYERYSDTLLSINKENSATKRTYITIEFGYAQYFKPDKWFFSVDVAGDHRFYETDSDREDIYPNSYVKKRYYGKENSWSASITGGIGYGKIRDGSVVFLITRVIDKFQEEGILKRSLTNEELLRLVEIVSKRMEYAFSHERYLKYFMEDFFQEIQKMDVLKDNVPSAYTVMRTIEALWETAEPRRFGWLIKLGIQRSFYENIDFSSIYSLSNSYQWNTADFLKLDCEYAYPFSLNLQFNTSLNMSIPKSDYKRKINSNGNAYLVYQLADRIRTGIKYSFYRSQNLTHSAIYEDNFQRDIEHRLSMIFDFFIENHITFNIIGSYMNRTIDRYSPINISKSTYKSPSISFRVNYRFF